FLALLFVLLRSRVGSSLQAIRDDEEAAASVGVSVLRCKWILFVVAGVGCGAAGALTLANTLFIEPTSIFGVDWTAYMIFMVLVGGLGTFEGPIVGAIVLFVIQNEFGNNGVWYLDGLRAARAARRLGHARRALRPARDASRLPATETVMRATAAVTEATGAPF